MTEKEKEQTYKEFLEDGNGESEKITKLRNPRKEEVHKGENMKKNENEVPYL